MITGADDLIATLSSDAAMIGAVLGLYALLRRGLRNMVRDEIETAVAAALDDKLGADGSARETIEDLRAATVRLGQQADDERDARERLAGRVGDLREDFIRYLGSRGH